MVLVHWGQPPNVTPLLTFRGNNRPSLHNFCSKWPKDRISVILWRHSHLQLQHQGLFCYLHHH
ncbi:hypothetical protein BCR41DRAFT_357470 [Lobosporangium transversale]|uniref:Uncharacterized protein n=1 Tax=Lobosporangium transversale TaxID=64571 RepID=A0A1Y2GGZ2_9FUNG|nr:hypothetical protein BCR41DRAFT_357470 [Lobosporangium transversale]ORZ10609.1 hypothetical protein BCR41DRAFT_357470 [Lobosporangium transversale]|eukprot:XP_021879330.1 hypothetical protein BCR41DRAFT_357470 [Lobosporangium transversale]